MRIIAINVTLHYLQMNHFSLKVYHIFVVCDRSVWCLKEETKHTPNNTHCPLVTLRWVNKVATLTLCALSSGRCDHSRPNIPHTPSRERCMVLIDWVLTVVVGDTCRIECFWGVKLWEIRGKIYTIFVFFITIRIIWLKWTYNKYNQDICVNGVVLKQALALLWYHWKKCQ